RGSPSAMRFRRGISSGVKTAIVLVAVVVVLASVYEVPTLLTPKKAAPPPVTCGSGTFQLLSLFSCFSQMSLTTIVDTTSELQGTIETEMIAYQVLGQANYNGTSYTKVEFATPGVGNQVVAWFNASGVVGRIDLLTTGRNYTGPGAAILAQSDTTEFGLIPTITNNSTLTSMLSQTTENTTTIGSVSVGLTVYHLAVPTTPYKSITVEYATIPGTTQQMLVYLNEKLTTGESTTIQVTSLTK
ncbi:MAG TPA: hypothetical protein VLU99_07535, partial [Nitrososphaerales archaeon]|nr:hypothetical protein [Nitrososphaerales archaeon]